jgi:transposase
MPAYTNAKRIFKYSDEFKMKAVQWSFDPRAKA